jgi:TetR/AcrR family transcriptional repressor of mexJK operon
VSAAGWSCSAAHLRRKKRGTAGAAARGRRAAPRHSAAPAEALSVLTARGLLRIDDPGVAAEQLTWLVVAAPLNRLTLQAGAHPYGDHELKAVAAQGVTTFMSRYGPEDMDRR